MVEGFLGLCVGSCYIYKNKRNVTYTHTHAPHTHTHIHAEADTPTHMHAEADTHTHTHKYTHTHTQARRPRGISRNLVNWEMRGPEIQCLWWIQNRLVRPEATMKSPNPRACDITNVKSWSNLSVAGRSNSDLEIFWK